jgi:hypothetical protein
LDYRRFYFQPQRTAATIRLPFRFDLRRNCGVSRHKKVWRKSGYFHQIAYVIYTCGLQAGRPGISVLFLMLAI